MEDNIYIRSPRTKLGKTETIVYDIEKVKEEYGLEPKTLIDLKALMGDSSDEIPGCPGVGPKTATELLKKYNTLDKLYEALEDDSDAKLSYYICRLKDINLIIKIYGIIY